MSHRCTISTDQKTSFASEVGTLNRDSLLEGGLIQVNFRPASLGRD